MVSGKADGASRDGGVLMREILFLVWGTPAGEVGRREKGPETNLAGGEVSWALIDDQDSKVHRWRNRI